VSLSFSRSNVAEFVFYLNVFFSASLLSNVPSEFGSFVKRAEPMLLSDFPPPNFGDIMPKAASYAAPALGLEFCEED
jgi:hypothetical protein